MRWCNGWCKAHSSSIEYNSDGPLVCKSGRITLFAIGQQEGAAMHKETQCVHSGTRIDPTTGGVNTPIFPSAANRYLDREETPYPRYLNVANQHAVVEKLCALEGAEDGVVFSSGMAAITTSILACVQAGDHVVLQDELYGGTHTLVTQEFSRRGIDYTFAATNAEAIARAITDRTRMLVLESPTNPLLTLLDIRAVASLARERGIITMLDNTFATPIYQNPLARGIDIVTHSATKYLAGHSDLVCGAALSSATLTRQIRAVGRLFGGSLNPFDCSLLERSLKTLVVRMERQTANAGQIATFLHEHALVSRVFYPGLPDHPQHALARVQMRGFGAMLSFAVDEHRVNPDVVLRRLCLIVPAVSLGGVETIICAPAQTSHSGLTPDERARMGVTDGLLRLSVGIEHVDDLIADLDQALNGAVHTAGHTAP